MKILFQYSLREEAKRAVDMVTHPSEYSSLRSVIWPSPKVFSDSVMKSAKALKDTQNLWGLIDQKVEKAFVRLGLIPPEGIVCYVHFLGCEGWFEPDHNIIHVRCSENDSLKERADTIIHEIIHLATYKKSLSYEQWEKIVDDYMKEQDLKDICLNVEDTELKSTS